MIQQPFKPLPSPPEVRMEALKLAVNAGRNYEHESSIIERARIFEAYILKDKDPS